MIWDYNVRDKRNSEKKIFSCIYSSFFKTEFLINKNRGKYIIEENSYIKKVKSQTVYYILILILGCRYFSEIFLKMYVALPIIVKRSALYFVPFKEMHKIFVFIA